MFVLGRISISCNLQVQYHKSGTNFTLLLLVVPILGDLFLIFRSLGAVFGTGLASVCNTCRIQRTSNDVVSGTGQILNSSATDQNLSLIHIFPCCDRDIFRLTFADFYGFDKESGKYLWNAG